MGETPEVSVVMSVYNGAEKLAETLQSVQHEHVVVLDRLNRTPFHLSPLRTYSAYGFGPMILKRIRHAGESNESAHAHTGCW